MALVDLITDLSNFVWTQYDTVGTAVNNIPDVYATGFTLNMQQSQFIIDSIPEIQLGIPVRPPQGPAVTMTPGTLDKDGSNIIKISPRKSQGSIFESEQILPQFSTEPLEDIDVTSEYTKFPYRNNSGFGFDQPFITRDIGDHWGIDPAKSFKKSPLRKSFNVLDQLGGLFLGENPSVIVGRSVADLGRLGKFMITPMGAKFITKQTFLQALSPFSHTKFWNPLSIGSAVATVHVTRHLDNEVAEAIGEFIEVNGTKILNQSKLLLDNAVTATKTGLSNIGNSIADAFTRSPGPPIPDNDTEMISNSSAELTYAPALENANEQLPKAAPINIKPEPKTPVGNLLNSAKTKMKSVISPSINSILPKRNTDSLTDRVEEMASKDSDAKTSKYFALAYGHLQGENAYGVINRTPNEIYNKTNGRDEELIDAAHDTRLNERRRFKKLGDGNWAPGAARVAVRPKLDSLGIIKKRNIDGGYITEGVDTVNIHPYGSSDNNDDLIPFKFKDIVNNKWLIFRATLSGITDSITPEWSPEKYIGRPDKVHVYQGADREISFTFSIYPKTKQELPILWEKMNYLVGLCYPSWGDIKSKTGADENNNPVFSKTGTRMISPFIELTIGNLFKNTPGYLNSLSITVEDNTTWELDENLQLPKYLNISCGFTYIGKYLPSTIGKHYELEWLKDSLGDGTGTYAKNPFTDTSQKSPYRSTKTINLSKLFGELNA